MSQPFMDRARVHQPSNDPDTAAGETIGLMTTYIKESARDPLVQAEARRAVDFYPSPLLAMSGVAGDDPRLSFAAREQAAAESCWAWAKHNLEFVHHSKLLLAWLNKDDALQLLVSPDVIVHALNGEDLAARDRARKGDCAVFSPMICALLECIGLDWELVIAAVDRSQPEIFSHVWPRVVLSDGRRIDLDASHGPYPGWHVPGSDIFRLQAWDSSGRAIADRGDTFTGFGEYIGTGLAGDTVDEFGNIIYGGYGAGYDPSATPPFVAPSGSAWTNVLPSLLTQWTKIGADVIAPRTTYSVGPGGQVSYSTPGQALPPNSAALNIGGGSTLLWVGGGLAALLIAAMAFGGRK